ncbi:MAG: TlpA family protein disulfide reductase [Anaplasma sp.]
MKRSRMGKIAIRAACFAIIVFFLLHRTAAAGDGRMAGAAGEKSLPEAFVRGALKQDMRVAAAPFFDLNAKQFSAKDFSGQVLIVTFWAPWSVDSAALLRELQAIWEHLEQKGAGGITFLPISYGDGAAVRSFCDEYGITLTVYLDQDRRLFDYFNVQSIPLTFIVDGDGSVLYRIGGNVKWDSTDVLNKLLSMVTQKTEGDATGQPSAEAHSQAAEATSALPQEQPSGM